MKMFTAWIFLTEGGTKLWKTDEDCLSNKEILEQYLTPNGFHGRVKCVQSCAKAHDCTSAGTCKCPAAKGDVLYYEVNPDAMNMNDFYSWTEFLASGRTPSADIDIWRPFFWLGEKPGQDDEFLWRAEMKSVGKLAFLDDFWSAVG